MELVFFPGLFPTLWRLQATQVKKSQGCIKLAPSWLSLPPHLPLFFSFTTWFPTPFPVRSVLPFLSFSSSLSPSPLLPFPLSFDFFPLRYLSLPPFFSLILFFLFPFLPFPFFFPSLLLGQLYTTLSKIEKTAVPIYPTYLALNSYIFLDKKRYFYFFLHKLASQIIFFCPL